MKKIVLISGLARHGKDTTANFLKQKLNGTTLIIHNADYLKYISKEYLGWDGNKDNYGRNLLQWLGTDRTRTELNKPLFWIEKTCDAIEITKNKYDYFLVPDCRFSNEIHYPMARFPNMVIDLHINRYNFTSNLTDKQKNHPSERGLDNFKHEYCLRVQEGLEYLEKEVDFFIEEYLKN